MDIPKAPTRPRWRRVFAGGLGLALLLGASLGLRQLNPRAPSVERAALWVDTVRRGPMLREVLGQGRLVPEEIRWLAARSNAQVERVLLQPGAAVHADTIVAELTNSELELAALEAERELTRAEAELVHVEASLNGERLAHESAVASLKSELDGAARRARADEELARRGFLSELERGQALGRERELEGRLDFELERRVAMGHGRTAQRAAQRAQIERLRSIAEFRRKELAGLSLRAGVDGVLQELSLEQGQRVVAGSLLGKVARPDRLKAEIRVPETQATDIALGQWASIDTRNGLVPGHVVRIAPAVQAGNVLVDVTLDGALPAGARPDLNVEGRIELERLPDVLFLARPVAAVPGSRVGLFRLNAQASHAERVDVWLGRSSATSVEIVSGLQEGDRVILSELSQWDELDRIRLR